MALCTDDILIYSEQPTQSVPKLMSCLEVYGSLSGYKLNVLSPCLKLQTYHRYYSKISTKMGCWLNKISGHIFTKKLGKLFWHKLQTSELQIKGGYKEKVCYPIPEFKLKSWIGQNEYSAMTAVSLSNFACGSDNSTAHEMG